MGNCYFGVSTLHPAARLICWSVQAKVKTRATNHCTDGFREVSYLWHLEYGHPSSFTACPCKVRKQVSAKGVLNNVNVCSYYNCDNKGTLKLRLYTSVPMVTAYPRRLFGVSGSLCFRSEKSPND